MCKLFCYPIPLLLHDLVKRFGLLKDGCLKITIIIIIRLNGCLFGMGVRGLGSSFFTFRRDIGSPFMES